jgi:tetratricopeptide (TPR) repeat protein
MLFAIYSPRDILNGEDRRFPTVAFRFKNPPPANADDFERLCLRLLKAYWNLPKLELYGRRGERQHGVDIIETSGAETLRAAQCKLYDASETLPPAEIQAEVNAAVGFPFPLSVYAICTTAKVSTQAQNAILLINREHQRKGLFAVELFTWHRLDELLEEFTTVRDEVYGTLSGEVTRQLQISLSGIKLQLTDLETQAVSTAKESADGLHQEIDQARDLVRSGQPQAARLLLERLRTRKWDQMEPRHRYRVLANIGAAYLGERDFPRAAQLFLEAAVLQPEDSQAAENEALAYFITMTADKAFEAITQVRVRFPHAPRINAYWITTAPSTETRIQIEQRLTAADLSTPEVITALASRALAECEFDVSEKLAAQAMEQRPEWSFPQFLKARASTLGVIESDVLSPSTKIKAFRAVLGPLKKAIEAAAKEHDFTTQTLCLLERFQMHSILNEMSEAETDVLSAKFLSPDNIDVKRAIAELNLKKNDPDRAISELRDIKVQDRADVALLLAEALRRRRTQADISEAIDLLKKLVDSPNRAVPGGREYVASALLQLLSQAQRWQESEQICDSLLARGASPALVSAYRARSRHLQKLLDDANRLAGEASSLLLSNAPYAEVHWIAQILSELGRHAEALPLWQRIASRTELTDYTKGLLNCAQLLGRDDLILDTCSALRVSGVFDSDLILCEAGTLEKYDVDGAIAALTDYLEKRPDDNIARLRLSVIGTNWNRPEIVDGRPGVMPVVTEVDVINGRAAVHVMKLGGYPDDALAYAYDLLRLHFNDSVAHRAYTFNLLPFVPLPTVPEFSEVKAGCAVCYVEEYESQEVWMIVEDAPNPDMSRQEYGPDHPLSVAMTGKKFGERVILSASSLGARAATIRAITSKYVFRFQDSMRNWQIRFPEVAGLQSFKVMRTNKEGKEEFDPSPIIASIEQLARNLQRLKELYISAPMPIHMLAAAQDKSTIQATLYLAQQDDAGALCCMGAEDERTNALAALDTSGTWIIEPSALATIFLLDLEDVLSSLPVNLVLSQGTVAEFDEMLREDMQFHGDGSVVVKHGPGFAFIPLTVSEREERIQSLTSRINKVKSASTVVGCIELAKLDEHHRNIMIKALGEGGAESVVLAATPGHLLWTDDCRLGGFARTEYGVKSAWTQVVLQWATLRGYISEQTFFKSSARLIGFGYSFTSPSLSVLIAAAEIADWDQSRRPFCQAIDQLRTESIQLRDAASLTVSFLERVYRESILDERRRVITLALIDKLGNRLGGPSIVQEIKRAVPVAFGLNALGAVAATSTIDAWLNSRTIRTIG